jgi:hypothetical protein
VSGDFGFTKAKKAFKGGVGEEYNPIKIAKNNGIGGIIEKMFVGGFNKLPVHGAAVGHYHMNIQGVKVNREMVASPNRQATPAPLLENTESY